MANDRWQNDQRDEDRRGEPDGTSQSGEHRGGGAQNWEGAYGSSGMYGSRRRGPKGYQRSDSRIHEDVCEHLANTQHIDANDVTVEVKDGTVTLLGTVPHRQMKHCIEDLVAECPGVKDVDKKLRVPLTAAWPEPTASFGDAGRASHLHEPPY